MINASQINMTAHNSPQPSLRPLHTQLVVEETEQTQSSGAVAVSSLFRDSEQATTSPTLALATASQQQVVELPGLIRSDSMKNVLSAME